MRLDNPIFIVYDSNGDFHGVFAKEDHAEATADYHGAFVVEIIEVSDDITPKVKEYLKSLPF